MNEGINAEIGMNEGMNAGMNEEVKMQFEQIIP